MNFLRLRRKIYDTNGIILFTIKKYSNARRITLYIIYMIPLYRIYIILITNTQRKLYNYISRYKCTYLYKIHVII